MKVSMLSKYTTIIVLLSVALGGCDDRKQSPYAPVSYYLSSEASFPYTIQTLKNRWFYCEKCLNDKKCLPGNVQQCQNITLPDRANALNKAVGRANLDAIDFLVNVAKTDVNSVTGIYRETPLIISSYYGSGAHIKIAEFLISRGANVNALDASGNPTALMTAIWKNNIEFVRFLLKNGADPSLTSEGRKEGAACKVAIAYKRSEIIPIIPGCCSLIAYEPDRMQGVLNKCP
jgi:ankyrin repeat protein